MISCIQGFNGERLDQVSRHYHLGNGYRAYSSHLMRFTCPDSMSPFGAGGINPYVYCAGDPVNHADPTGHLSWQAWLGIGMGIAGLGLTVFTGGASIAAAGGIVAAIESASAASLAVGGLGVVSDGTAIVSEALKESHPRTSSVLGWASFAFGMLSLGTGLVASEYRSGNSIANKTSLFNAKRITWGSVDDIDNVQTLGIGKSVSHSRIRDTYYSFDDLKNGQRRLNIVAHGRFEESSGYATVGFDNVCSRYTGKKFAIYLRDMGIDFSEYRRGGARLIICFSGDGIDSFASQFSHESGLTIKAFSGPVTTEGELQSMVNAHSFPEYLERFYNGNLSDAEEILNETLVDIYPRNNLFRIIKDNRDIYGGYNPVKNIFG
jgi:RHS repeat-associated protein